MNIQLRKSFINTENILVSMLRNRNDPTGAIATLLLSNTTSPKKSDSLQIVRQIYERDEVESSRQSQIDEDVLSKFELITPQLLDLYRNNIYKSKFDFDSSIDVLRKSGDFKQAFELLYKFRRLELISRDNMKVLKQFGSLLKSLSF